MDDSERRWPRLYATDFSPRFSKNRRFHCTLTVREMQVVRLLATGKSNKQVAGVLDISPRTVESHRNHIMRKMEFASFSDLIKFAIRNDLAEP
jgi:DNA-binding CsgD family transcriptional regulator